MHLDDCNTCRKGADLDVEVNEGIISRKDKSIIEESVEEDILLDEMQKSLMVSFTLSPLGSSFPLCSFLIYSAFVLSLQVV